MAAPIVQPRLRSGSNNVQLDAEGRELIADVREDEEQNVKLQETIELLLAAGYFRARIKGLSPFDKVEIIGSIEHFNLTFSLTIFSLTEKIVAVLPRMKCPHRIEPHQIQGLDFIHIYPVVQWLVKRAIETREEMGDQIRAFSVWQFNKHHQTPQDIEFESQKPNSVSSGKIKDVYRPQRKYRRAETHKLKDEESRIQSTLLEYGRRHGVSTLSRTDKESEKNNKKKAIAAGLQAGDEEKDLEEMRKQEERKIQSLMKGLAAMETEEGRIAAAMVGSIVGLQSDEIEQIASEYAGRQSELQLGDASDKLSGTQQHQRTVASLNKQIKNSEKKKEKITPDHADLKKSHEEAEAKLAEVQALAEKINQEMEKLEGLETEENKEVLQKLRGLVAKNESLKKQEQEFRTQCKEEMAKLQQQVADLKSAAGQGVGELSERDQLIAKQFEADQAKLQKIRLLLARKNREISQLQRKMDEVPSRAELTQYQRRFVELYNQVNNTHRETKQFYTLYNTLDDTKLYLEKEITLLNSIHDNFQQAMASPSSTQQFLKQFEQMVEGIKGTKL
ncbi:putative coiled-coil domain-containing protein [Apostichopus japonicus]|uniref:Coiled-coil domain-containing protein 93 n=1 Tax=Stichopus japonicus TaxID=307972 RepID=A0A2G8L0R9_STIJA|nr:putative coiled-coil domain-containing protein [Apostichopus japonicus]